MQQSKFVLFLKKWPAHKLFFFLLVLLLPLGGRLRFVNAEAMLYGRVGDYIVPELYGTDIVLCLVLFAWLYAHVRSRSNSHQASSPTTSSSFLFAKHSFFWFVYSGLFLGGLLSLVNALNLQASMYRLLKLGEWGLLILYISRQRWERRDLGMLAGALIAGGVYESLLSWFQFATQSSLTSGFISHAIGEQPISIWEQGISYIWVLGQKTIRPYGTFDHPNVLAGYLMVSFMTAFVVLVRLNAKSAENTQRSQRQKKAFLFGALALIGGTIGLTLSRIVWAVLVANMCLVLILFGRGIGTYLRTRISSTVYRVFCIIILLVGAFISGGGFYLMFLRVKSLWSYNQISVVGRMFLNKFAFQMIGNHPLGIGPGNFTVVIRDYDLSGLFDTVLQPVHNVFLLVASEMGVLAGICFVGMIGYCFWTLLAKRQTAGSGEDTISGGGNGTGRDLSLHLFFILFSFLFIMFFDHYLWTLQQGQIMLWGVIGFALALGGKHRTQMNTDELRFFLFG